VWKLHNMVTAAVVPDSAPFPASAGLPASRFSLEAPLPLRLSTIDDITRFEPRPSKNAKHERLRAPR